MLFARDRLFSYLVDSAVISSAYLVFNQVSVRQIGDRSSCNFVFDGHTLTGDQSLGLDIR